MAVCAPGEFEGRQAEEMSISAIQSSMLFSQLSSASATSSSSSTSGQNAFGTALDNLMNAIQSGDTTSAQKYLAQVEQLSPNKTNGSDPLGTFLTSVESALSNNDIKAAQTALTTLESSTAANGTDQTSLSSMDSSSLSELGSDLLSLFSAVSNGDLSGAQTAYNNLTSLLGTSSSSSSSDTSSTASTDSSSSSSSSSSTNFFTKMLTEIGTALNNGDVSGAQAILNAFAAGLSSGSLMNTSA